MCTVKICTWPEDNKILRTLTHSLTRARAHTHTHAGFDDDITCVPQLQKPPLMRIPFLITAKTGKKLAELAEVLLGPAGSTVQIDFRCGSSKKEFSVIVPVCASLSLSLSVPLQHTVPCRRALHGCGLVVSHTSSSCSFLPYSPDPTIFSPWCTKGGTRARRARLLRTRKPNAGPSRASTVLCVFCDFFDPEATAAAVGAAARLPG